MASIVVFDRKQDPQSKLDNYEFRLGVYDIDFDCTLIPTTILPIPEKVKGKEFKVDGKLVRIESITYHYEEKKILGFTYAVGLNRCTLRLRILQNPLPALAVILAAGAFLAFAAGYMVLQVRMLAEENPAIAAGVSGLSIFVFGGLIYGGYKLLSRKM